MSIANKFNKVQNQVNTEGFSYVTLAKLYEENKDAVHPLNGLFIRSGKFGKQPVFINVERQLLVNIPSHMAKISEDILQDTEAMEAVENGKVGYTIYNYTSHNRNCYGITFVDIN